MNKIKQDSRETIRRSLLAFSDSRNIASFKERSICFFNALGYASSRSIDVDSPKDFRELFDRQHRLDVPSARVKDWRSISILFQLTGEDLDGQIELPGLERKFDSKHAHSYLFLALELKKGHYTRNALATIARQISRLFPQPIMILFKMSAPIGTINSAADERKNAKSPYLTLVIINRRPSKVDIERDVLSKVTFISDINTVVPHRGHLEILADLTYNEICTREKIRTFDNLHRAFEKAFNVELLNKRFYAEISQWYHWAVETIILHGASYSSLTEGQLNRQSLFVIRLFCRLIFCWFLKEKKLIARQLFEFPDFSDLRDLFGADTVNSQKFNMGQHYFKGVLQAVFFNCLNTPVGHAERKIENDECAKHLKKAIPQDLFDSIPYLNGGLFDRLDDDKDISELFVPNELFFADGRRIKNQRGLNKILMSYKFTVTENTPLEEEIALDPELLGCVLENLLAEIDGTDSNSSLTARKASGTYYTPRQIIDYMVNESLRLHLEETLRGQHAPADQQQLIPLLFLQNQWDPQHPAASFLAKRIVEAFDSCRILDPSCGSGAFLMGAFHRMVEILRLVDPKNVLWKKRYLARFTKEQQRDNISKQLGLSENADYLRKMALVSNTLYGIDIHPVAVLITKLRFFISLLAEQHPDDSDKANNFGLIPFPNLETKILCANTLQSPKLSRPSKELIDILIKTRKEYSNRGISKPERERLLEKIADQMNIIFPSLASLLSDSVTGSGFEGKAVIQKWFRHPTAHAPTTSFEIFFPEVCSRNCKADPGFDIVIGNPPYGGSKISDELKDALNLKSKDPYGAFISRFLPEGREATPLRIGGVLAYIVSDTFMTIKTHRPLREQLMGSRIHKMIRVRSDTFSATVNTAIILLQKGGGPGAKAPTDAALAEAWEKGPWCQMVDLSPVSIRVEHDRFLQLLLNISGGERRRDIATESCAVYHYPQSLIATNTNLPFFVASPKLFRLMNDTTSLTHHENISGKTIPVRTVRFNEKDVRLIKLGDIAEVKQGLSTGDNAEYLFQNPVARGKYRSIEDYREFLLADDDLERIRSDDVLRSKIIQKGISKTDKKSSRYFGGRYITPYDKGGESDSDDGWMPNYWVSTNYFIDWSEWAVKRMRTLTIGERDGTARDTVCAVFRSPDRYFTKGVSFSRTGIYAPTFRFGSSSPFDTEGSMLFFPESVVLEDVIGYCASRLVKCQLKAFIGHTVHTQVDELKEAFLPVTKAAAVAAKVLKITKTQRVTPRYDYASNEQLEIDKLVYESYGLERTDIAEVETWYARRYPKLAVAQRRNLRNADKVPNFDRWCVYCDESGHLAYDHIPRMVLGALLVPRERVRPLTLELRSRLAAIGWPAKRELKWTKVSQSGLKFYETALDFFLQEPDLRFRALVVPKSPSPAKLPRPPKSDDLESPEWEAYLQLLEDTAPAAVDFLHAHDAWYYDRYFDLLRETLLPPARHAIFMDVKDTRGGTRIRALEERLSDAHYDWTRSGIVEGVSQIDSSDVLLDQLVDLLLGCVSWMHGTPQRNAGHDPNPGKAALAAKFANAMEKMTDDLVPKVIIDFSAERSPER